MDPATGAAAFAAAASALSSVGGAISGKKNRKLAREQLREQIKAMTRRTNAELMNSALDRQHKSALKNKELRGVMKSRQAQALTDLANGFRSSLVGG